MSSEVQGFLGKLNKLVVPDKYYSISHGDTVIGMRILKARERHKMNVFTLNELMQSYSNEVTNTEEFRSEFSSMLQFNEFCYSIVEIGGDKVSPDGYVDIDGVKKKIFDVLRTAISSWDAEVFESLIGQYMLNIRSNNTPDLTETSLNTNDIVDYGIELKKIVDEDESMIKELSDSVQGGIEQQVQQPPNSGVVSPKFKKPKS